MSRFSKNANWSCLGFFFCFIYIVLCQRGTITHIYFDIRLYTSQTEDYLQN